GEHADFAAGEVRQFREFGAGVEDGWSINEQADALEPFVGAQRQKGFVEFRILNSALSVFNVFEQTGRPEHLEPAVNAAQELGRRDKPLDRIELRALDHPWCGAELAAWIKLRFDPPVAAGLDQPGKNLHPFVLGVIERLRPELHYDGSGLRPNVNGRQPPRYSCADTAESGPPVYLA